MQALCFFMAKSVHGSLYYKTVTENVHSFRLCCILRFTLTVTRQTCVNMWLTI